MCLLLQTLTPLVLELGGKDPFIVCEDADIDAAVAVAMRGTYQVSPEGAPLRECNCK